MNDNATESTPVDLSGDSNEPGQEEIHYRVNTYPGFMAEMRAALSTTSVQPDPTAPATNALGRPLSKLTTRQPNDPTMALLDAWACVGDVLTFYQERIANEGFLRTALHRRSLLELSRLVGYVPRPGVAASVYLSFTAEDGASLAIPAGSAVQSVPAPEDVSQIPQTFETAEALEASAQFNVLKPKVVRPLVCTGQTALEGVKKVFVKGLANGLHEEDILLLTCDSLNLKPVAYQIKHIELRKRDAVFDDRTEIDVEPLQFASTEKVKEPGNGTTSATGIKGVFQSFSTKLKSAGKAAMRLIAPRPPVPPNSMPVAMSSASTNESTSTSPIKSGSGRALGNVLGIVESKSTTSRGSEGDVEAAFVAKTVPTHAAAPVGVPALVAKPVAPTAAAPLSVQSLNEPRAQLLEELTTASSSQLAGAIRVSGASDASKDEAQAAKTLDGSANSGSGPQGAESSSPILTSAPIQVFVFRTKAAPFGKDAPLKTTAVQDKPVKYEEWNDDEFKNAHGEDATQLILNKAYPGVRLNSWVMVVTPRPGASVTGSPRSSGAANTSLPRFFKINGVADRVAKGLGPAVNATQLSLEKGIWHDPDFKYGDVRQTNVWLGSELLDTSRQDNPDHLVASSNAGSTLVIELDRVYRNLETGRLLILAGEIEEAPGVQMSDLVSLVTVEHSFSPWDSFTRIVVELNLPATGSKMPSSSSPTATSSTAAYSTSPDTKGDVTANGTNAGGDTKPATRSYSRRTLKICGNVVVATHGESRKEVLGSGDTSIPVQSFALKASPLTYVSAANDTGAQSTLKVYVNDIQWHEASDGLSRAGPNDHLYVVRTDQTDDGGTKTSIIFGDGTRGAAPPSGRENIRAEYRTGIGTPGNVAAGRISQLKSRPHGLKGVDNPLAASGGADAEAADSIRANAPVGVRALGRLVSLHDYKDFARTFAGVTKAVAVLEIYDGKPGVKVFVAGAGSVPVQKTSDLITNLKAALSKYGSPAVPSDVFPHRRRIIFLQVAITPFPDFVWANVQAAVRSALLYNFGFEGQKLGQALYQNDVAKVIQLTPGVQYVFVKTFTSIGGDIPMSIDGLNLQLTNAFNSPLPPLIQPASDEVAYLSPDIDQSLVINLSSLNPLLSTGSPSA